MKLTPQQLDQNLNKPLGHAYWLSGDEPLLVLEAQDKIRKSAFAQGITEREVFHTDATFVVEELIQSTQSLSLFGDKTLIELRITGKVTEPIRKALLSILENPSPDHLLLITSGKIDASTQKAKWFANLEKNLNFVQFWPVTIEQLPQWITHRAKSLNLQFDPDALKFIAEKVDGNLLAAKQELEKLALTYAGTTISIEQIATAIADSARWSIFDLSDSVTAGKSDRALRILSGLKSEGLEAPIVLWSLTKDLRSLVIIKNQLQRGMPENQVYRAQQVWDKRKPMINAALKRLTVKDIHGLLQQAGTVDRMIKGQEKGDIWSNLRALVWSFSRDGQVF